MAVVLGTLGAILGAASSAAKMGGQIASANKLSRAQSPESIYAQRYNQSFQNALSADLNNQMRATGMANTPAGQVAAAQSLLGNLNTAAASAAATGDARNYTNMAMEGQQRDAQKSAQIGDAVGGFMGASGQALGALQMAQDRAATLDKEQERYEITLYNGSPLAVTPPNFIELEITETDPGLKGDTAQGGSKPATLSTGAVVRVPLFITEGEVIRADKEEEDGDPADGTDGEGSSEGDEDGEDGEASEGSDKSEDTEDGTDTDGEPSDTDEGETNEGGTTGGSGAGAEQEALTAEEVAASIVDALEDGEDSGIKTHNEALDALVEADNQKEAANVLPGEKRWNPWNPDGDVVMPAAEGSRSAANTIRNKARKSGGALKTQLRRKFLADRSTRRFHGVKRGRGLSERRLVDSAVEMAANVTPTRPDFADVAKRDCSLAAAIIVDQSGSMHSRRETAAIAMMALADGLDGVGAPVLCAGFRDIWGNNYGTPDVPMVQGTDGRHFHRSGNIGIDVFKGWEEPLRKCVARFPSVQATGGTPMADGVQYGMQALSERPERHRVLFVLTDGEPDWDHTGVMRRQIRLAREAGIEVVGVGIDAGCYGVRRTFETGVAVENLEELPKAILSILDDIVFPSKAKRVKLDGKFSKKRRRTA